MELSEKVKSITPSQTIEITNAARKLREEGWISLVYQLVNLILTPQQK